MEKVVALVPRDFVDLVSSEEPVVTAKTAHGVLTFAVVESVITLITAENIVPGVCIDLVVPAVCVDVVLRIRAVHVVAFFSALAIPILIRRTKHCIDEVVSQRHPTSKQQRCGKRRQQ